MTRLVLDRCDARVLVSHLALLGLLAIVEDGEPQRLITGGWTHGMSPRPWVEAEGLDVVEIGGRIRSFAAKRSGDGEWIAANVDGTDTALMSPRAKAPVRSDEWSGRIGHRRRVIDTLLDESHDIDLRMLGGLGELSFWHTAHNGDARPDHGASRFDMQTRNSGSELVGTKVRPLARIIAGRSHEAIADGLTGVALRDEIGQDRSATGFAPPGPIDSAIAWCAFWGMASLPVAPRVAHSATTAIARVGRQDEILAFPLWTIPQRPAAVRGLVADERTTDVAEQASRGEANGDGPDPAASAAASEWLARRGVVAVVSFTVELLGSTKAPERRARRGTVIPTGRRVRT